MKLEGNLNDDYYYFQEGEVSQQTEVGKTLVLFSGIVCKGIHVLGFQQVKNYNSNTVVYKTGQNQAILLRWWYYPLFTGTSLISPVFPKWIHPNRSKPLPITVTICLVNEPKKSSSALSLSLILCTSSINR